jgi:endo-beta-N-acetylglucosaminidase D
MRKVVMFLAISAVLASQVSSADADFDVDLMQAIEDTNKSLSSNVALKNSKAATADAKELTQMFEKVETFFVQKGGAENAVDLAKQSKGLAIEIVNSVAANNFDAATNSATALSRTCRTCHTFYKKE